MARPATRRPAPTATPQSAAEQALADGKRRQQEAVDRQNEIEANSQPTPSQEETDRARLGLPVDLEPSGYEIDDSIHPNDAHRDASVGERAASYKTRDSAAD